MWLWITATIYSLIYSEISAPHFPLFSLHEIRRVVVFQETGNCLEMGTISFGGISLEVLAITKKTI